MLSVASTTSQFATLPAGGGPTGMKRVEQVVGSSDALRLSVCCAPGGRWP